jgi:hypothetical protein
MLKLDTNMAAIKSLYQVTRIILPSRFQIVILKEDSNMKVINNSNVG